MYSLQDYLIYSIIYIFGPISIFIIPIASTILYQKNRKVLFDRFAATGETSKPISTVVFCLIMILAEAPLLLAFYFGVVAFIIPLECTWIIIVINLIIIHKVARSLYKKNISSRSQKSVNSEDPSPCMSIEQFSSKVLVAEAIVIAIIFLYMGAYGAAVIMSV